MSKARTFQTGDATHTEGALKGEPARIPRERVSVPKGRDTAEVYPMARVAVARARAMGQPEPSWARKFLEREEEPGDVPGDGVPPSPKVKGSIIPEIVPSRLIPDIGTEWRGLVEQGEVIDPPFNPYLLVSTVLESDSLGPAIEAMATNTSGFGADLVPLFKTEDPETGAKLDPPPEAEEERLQIRLFLATCSVEGDLTTLAFQVDRDVEETGNGYVEVLRNRLGEVAALSHAPSWTMRLGRLSQPVLVDQPVRHPDTGEILILPRWRRFRTFIQIREQRVTYFKQFGDPRSLNRKTGRFKPPGESWGVDELGNHLDASEVRHFKIYASWTPYGVPRWLGAMPQIRAGRYTGELMADWFDSAPIGTKVAMVAGGVWSEETMNQVSDKIDDMARGIDNAWSVLFLEAKADSRGRDPIDGHQEQRPGIVFDDLAVQLPPELYQGGDSLWSLTRSHVRGMFRLPPIYFGDSDDYTRATSATARATAEEQVFVPLRERRWGAFFNHELLPSLQINHWSVSLRGANTTDDAELPIDSINTGGGASPNALIDTFNELTGSQREKIQEPWADRPLALTLELIKLKLDPNKPLDELVQELQAKEEEEKEKAAAQLAALNGDGAPGGPEGGDQEKDDAEGGPPPELAQKMAVADALDIVARASAIKRALVRQIEEPDDAWLA